MLQRMKKLISMALCAVMAVVTLTAGFAGSVYAETAPMEEELHDAVMKQLALILKDDAKRDEALAKAELYEAADFYTAMEFPQLYAQMQQRIENGTGSTGLTILDASTSLRGKVVGVKDSEMLYFMQKDADGSWKKVESLTAPDELMDPLKRYSFRTGVEHPAVYLYHSSGVRTFIFDDTGKCSLVMDGTGHFYESDALMARWYQGWEQHFAGESSKGWAGALEYTNRSGLAQVHPKQWIDITITVLVIIGVLALIALVFFLLSRIKGENTDWFEKIPLAHRMTSFRPRYNMK